jgi:hypothetical protein
MHSRARGGGGWSCSACSFNNPFFADRCQICETERAGQQAHKGTRKGLVITGKRQSGGSPHKVHGSEAAASSSSSVDRGTDSETEEEDEATIRLTPAVASSASIRPTMYQSRFCVGTEIRYKTCPICTSPAYSHSPRCPDTRCGWNYRSKSIKPDAEILRDVPVRFPPYARPEWVLFTPFDSGLDECPASSEVQQSPQPVEPVSPPTGVAARLSVFQCDHCKMHVALGHPYFHCLTCDEKHTDAYQRRWSSQDWCRDCYISYTTLSKHEVGHQWEERRADEPQPEEEEELDEQKEEQPEDVVDEPMEEDEAAPLILKRRRSKMNALSDSSSEDDEGAEAQERRKRQKHEAAAAAVVRSTSSGASFAAESTSSSKYKRLKPPSSALSPDARNVQKSQNEDEHKSPSRVGPAVSPANLERPATSISLADLPASDRARHILERLRSGEVVEEEKVEEESVEVQRVEDEEEELPASSSASSAADSSKKHTRSSANASAASHTPSPSRPRTKTRSSLSKSVSAVANPPLSAYRKYAGRPPPVAASSFSSAAAAAPSARPLQPADQHDSVCNQCLDGGELFLCDYCTRAYHLECLEDQVTPSQWRKLRRTTEKDPFSCELFGLECSTRTKPLFVKDFDIVYIDDDDEEGSTSDCSASSLVSCSPADPLGLCCQGPCESEFMCGDEWRRCVTCEERDVKVYDVCHNCVRLKLFYHASAHRLRTVRSKIVRRLPSGDQAKRSKWKVSPAKQYLSDIAPVGKRTRASQGAMPEKEEMREATREEDASLEQRQDEAVQQVPEEAAAATVRRVRFQCPYLDCSKQLVTYENFQAHWHEAHGVAYPVVARPSRFVNCVVSYAGVRWTIIGASAANVPILRSFPLRSQRPSVPVLPIGQLAPVRPIIGDRCTFYSLLDGPQGLPPLSDVFLVSVGFGGCMVEFHSRMIAAVPMRHLWKRVATTDTSAMPETQIEDARADLAWVESLQLEKEVGEGEAEAEHAARRWDVQHSHPSAPTVKSSNQLPVSAPAGDARSPLYQCPHLGCSQQFRTLIDVRLHGPVFHRGTEPALLLPHHFANCLVSYGGLQWQIIGATLGQVPVLRLYHGLDSAIVLPTRTMIRVRPVVGDWCFVHSSPPGPFPSPAQSAGRLIHITDELCLFESRAGNARFSLSIHHLWKMISPEDVAAVVQPHYKEMHAMMLAAAPLESAIEDVAMNEKDGMFFQCPLPECAKRVVSIKGFQTHWGRKHWQLTTVLSDPLHVPASIAESLRLANCVVMYCGEEFFVVGLSSDHLPILRMHPYSPKCGIAPVLPTGLVSRVAPALGDNCLVLCDTPFLPVLSRGVVVRVVGDICTVRANSSFEMTTVSVHQLCKVAQQSITVRMVLEGPQAPMTAELRLAVSLLQKPPNAETSGCASAEAAPLMIPVAVAAAAAASSPPFADPAAAASTAAVSSAPPTRISRSSSLANCLVKLRSLEHIVVGVNSLEQLIVRSSNANIGTAFVLVSHATLQPVQPVVGDFCCVLDATSLLRGLLLRIDANEAVVCSLLDGKIHTIKHTRVCKVSQEPASNSAAADSMGPSSVLDCALLKHFTPRQASSPQSSLPQSFLSPATTAAPASSVFTAPLAARSTNRIPIPVHAPAKPVVRSIQAPSSSSRGPISPVSVANAQQQIVSIPSSAAAENPLAASVVTLDLGDSDDDDSMPLVLPAVGVSAPNSSRPAAAATAVAAGSIVNIDVMEIEPPRSALSVPAASSSAVTSSLQSDPPPPPASDVLLLSMSMVVDQLQVWVAYCRSQQFDNAHAILSKLESVLEPLRGAFHYPRSPTALTSLRSTLSQLVLPTTPAARHPLYSDLKSVDIELARQVADLRKQVKELTRDLQVAMDGHSSHAVEARAVPQANQANYLAMATTCSTLTAQLAEARQSDVDAKNRATDAYGEIARLGQDHQHRQAELDRARNHLRDFEAEVTRLRQHIANQLPPEQKVDNECVICLSGPRNMLFMPCSHLVTCQECAKRRTEIIKCPQCTTRIRKRISVNL